jgi:hypothetical protein
MSKDQIVSDAKAALVAGQDALLTQVLGDVADQSALEQKASDGTLSQADVDAAVAAAVGPLNDQIVALQAQDAADIKAGQDALAALQVKLDDLAQKEGVEASVIAGLQGSLAVLQDVVAKLSGLLPVPTT